MTRSIVPTVRALPTGAALRLARASDGAAVPVPHNSDEMLALLDVLAATPGRAAKEAILAAVIDEPLVRRVMASACDPFISYGISAPTRFGAGKMRFDEETEAVWGLLDALAGRLLTGDAAHQRVTEMIAALTKPSAELLCRIVDRNLRCGITATTVNAVRPGLIRIFNVMLARPFDTGRVKAGPVAVEPKLDGVRAAAVADYYRCEFYSRNGMALDAVAHLGDFVLDMISAARAALDTLPAPRREAWRPFFGEVGTLALDGEIVSGTLAETAGAVRRQDVAALDAVYHVFDAAPLSVFATAEAGFPLPYRERRNFLEWLLEFAPDGSIELVPMAVARDVTEVTAFYRQWRAEGMEGVMVKDLAAGYVKKRTHAWAKIKATQTAELRILDAFEGEGRFAGMLGGLVVAGEVDGVAVSSRVGTGFSERQRESFWRAHVGRDPEARLVGALAEVEFQEITLDGSLRHPVFVRFRDDVDTAPAEV